MPINIIACGGYLPKKRVKNDEIEVRLNMEEGWIKRRTGILERHVIDNENFVDSCQFAATTAIKQANINANEIGLIVLATTTPYQVMPSTAILLQKSLGIKQCMSFDIQAACAGFVYALVIAESLMKNNKIGYALVCGCDVFSHITDRNDQVTASVFGDGFGAVILQNQTKAKSRGIFYTNTGTDTEGADDLKIPWGIAQGTHTYETNKSFVTMNGGQVFKNAVHRMGDEIQLAMDRNQLTIDDIKYIVPHQANQRIIQAISEKLNIPMEKFLVSLATHGNTSAASIPLTLQQLFTETNNPNGIILLTGFGAGYTWGTVVCEL